MVTSFDDIIVVLVISGIKSIMHITGSQKDFSENACATMQEAAFSNSFARFPGPYVYYLVISVSAY